MLENLCYQFRFGWKKKMKDRLDTFMNDESGVGTIEIVLILVVLIALVIIFKSRIEALLGNVFDDIDKDAKSIYG